MRMIILKYSACETCCLTRFYFFRKPDRAILITTLLWRQENVYRCCHFVDIVHFWKQTMETKFRCVNGLYRILKISTEYIMN